MKTLDRSVILAAWITALVANRRGATDDDAIRYAVEFTDRTLDAAAEFDEQKNQPDGRDLAGFVDVAIAQAVWEVLTAVRERVRTMPSHLLDAWFETELEKLGSTIEEARKGDADPGDSVETLELPESIDIVFAEIEGTPNLQFVEVENPDGVSVSVGHWIDRGDGVRALRIEFFGSANSRDSVASQADIDRLIDQRDAARDALRKALSWGERLKEASRALRRGNSRAGQILTEISAERAAALEVIDGVELRGP